MDLQAAVWDTQTGAGIPSASVAIVDPTGKPNGMGVVADASGRFEINSSLLDQGYQLQITSAGYQGVIVAPYILAEQGGISLDQGPALAPVVITAKKGIPASWILGGLALVLLLLSASSKDGKMGAMSKTEWVDLAIKVGIPLGILFLVVIPLLKKFGLLGVSAQADANATAVDKSLTAAKNTGGSQSITNQTDATYTGWANQIYSLGGADPVDQQAIRNIVIQVDTLADMLSLVKAFGTRDVGGSFFSLCGLTGFQCPQMDLPTFLRATIPDQLGTVNNYLSSMGINYSI